MQIEKSQYKGTNWKKKKQFHKIKQSAEKLFYLLIFGISGIQKSLVQNDSESRGG